MKSKLDWPVYWLGIAFITFCVGAALVSGCNHGSNIPIDGVELSCVEQVTDGCVPEVIEEFCTTCEPEIVEVIVEVPVDGPTHCVLQGDLCWRGQYLNGAWVYVQYPCQIQPTDECDPVEPFTCDDYPDDTPRGHLPKECRGNR